MGASDTQGRTTVAGGKKVKKNPGWAGTWARLRRVNKFGPELSRAEPGRAEPSRAEPGRAGPGRAEPSRAEPIWAGPGQDGPRRPQNHPPVNFFPHRNSTPKVMLFAGL
jgi:hypothetical protein